MRINKFIAHATGLSRREADEALEKGQVSLNGQPAAMGAQINSGDTVIFRGKTLSLQPRYTYLLLNKPTGYVCSRRRQGDTPTIYELLPEALRSLKPVGRLDKDSSGLLLLTDDGDFAHRMTHPSFKKRKVYLVTLSGDLQPLHCQMINDFGVNLDDGRSQLTLIRQHDGDDRRWVVEMSEGRNRQIRRTFAALGYRVTKLHRTNFGDYALGDIPRGQFIEAKIS